ncbi:MAG: hypothetical protein JXR18_06030, partial [Neptuniibacter sp.]
TVDDDAPVTTDDGLLDTVDDNAEDVVIGTLSDLLGDDNYGADGAASSGSITIAAGDLGGTVTINGSNLEYTSDNDVDPDGNQPVTETFVYTIKDADGDTQTATFTVNLTDEKATIGDPTDSSVDEEGLSGNVGDSYLDGGDLAGEAVSVSAQDLDITWGTDGVGSVTFDDTQTGLSGITSGGQSVNFVLLSSDTLLVGYTGDTAPTADNYTTEGSVVYYASLSSAGTGSYDFTLVQPLDHDTANTEDDETLTFAFTALDAEDEGSSSTFTVTVDDDAPVTISPDRAFLINQIDQSVTGVSLDLADDDVDNNVGADQQGTLSFANISASGTPLGLTSGLSDVYLYTNGTILIASTLLASDFATAFADTNTQVFTVTLVGDTYDFELHQQLDAGLSSFNTNDGSYNFEGGNSNYAYYNDQSVNPNPDILLTPVQGPGYTGTSVNGNANEAGIGGGGGGQDVGGSEGIRVDFVSGIAGIPKNNLDYPVNDHTFDENVLVNGAQATLASQGGTASTVDVRAYIDDDNDDVVGDGTQQNIVSVIVGGVTFTTTTTLSGYTVTFDADSAGGVRIEGVLDGDTVQVYTANGLTTLEFDYVSDNTFSLGNFGAAVPEPGEVADLAFDLSLTDADSDSVVMTDAIKVQISPDDHVILEGSSAADTGVDAVSTTSDQAATLLGYAGDDELLGGDLNDILIGGEGDDLLSGGLGADTFKWLAGDESGGVDTTDFNLADNDTLNFADLLQSNDSYVLQAVDNGGSLQINVVDTTGGANTVVQAVETNVASEIDLALQLDSLIASGNVDDGNN